MSKLKVLIALYFTPANVNFILNETLGDLNQCTYLKPNMVLKEQGTENTNRCKTITSCAMEKYSELTD